MLQVVGALHFDDFLRSALAVVFRSSRDLVAVLWAVVNGRRAVVLRTVLRSG